MDGGRQRRMQRRERSPGAAAHTHISSLPDDILLHIFLCLPSLATLIRAACTCRSWPRAVASSQDFRRRFRALHPTPPLIGILFDSAACCPHPCVPDFAPVRPRDGDMAAAVRGGDFFLTSLHERQGEDFILDCRGGYVLLKGWDDLWGDEVFVVLNPLIRHSKLVFREPNYFALFGLRWPDVLKARLVCSDEDATSFRVILLGYRWDKDQDQYRVCAFVFTLETVEWSVNPWVSVPGTGRPNSDENFRNCDINFEDEGRMQANGFLYWIYYWGLENQRYLISLNTTTMELSFGDIPHQCLGRHCTYDAGETRDGKTCIVYSDRINIGILMQTRGDDGVERWVLNRLLNLQSIFSMPSPIELFVFAVRGGYVYLSTSAMGMVTPCWFISLCLQTMKLEKLFHRTYECDAHPYIMAWPTCLSGNFGQFALEDAP